MNGWPLPVTYRQISPGMHGALSYLIANGHRRRLEILSRTPKFLFVRRQANYPRAGRHNQSLNVRHRFYANVEFLSNKRWVEGPTYLVRES